MSTTRTDFNFAKLNERYQAMTALAVVHARFSTDMVGGVPAGGTTLTDTPEKALAAYVKHQLHLEGDEALAAIKRIMAHEIPGGVKDITPEGGEIDEKEARPVNLIRRDEFGPWLGDWMIKACLKAAASRVGLFVQTRGSKGDMAEMGQVVAHDYSFRSAEQYKEAQMPYSSNRIYLVDDEGKPAKTEFQLFRGRVNSPQGSVSIVTLSEVCLAGARFAFEYRFYNSQIKLDDVQDFLAAAMVVGLGSAKAFERGKFRIESGYVEMGESRKKAKSEKAKLDAGAINKKADSTEAAESAVN